MLKKYKQIWMPLLAAMIWGAAFTAQSLSAGTIGVLTFNGVRSVVASLVIGGMIAVRNAVAKKRENSVPHCDKKQVILGGISCGVCLTLGCYFQQLGMETTSAGKAGFITALYVVLVPIAGLFFKQRVRPIIWLCVAIATGGLYFLCIQSNEAFRIEFGDLMVFFCAIAYTAMTLCINHFTRTVDGLTLSCAQFTTQAIICAILVPFFETPTWGQITSNLLNILYVGVMSSAVGYTLQILSLKDGNPTVVSLLFSLESFFAVVFSAILLGDRLSGRELLGCGLMLFAVLLSQLPGRNKKEQSL